MTEEAKIRYFAETARVLRREGFQIERLENRQLNVMLNGQSLCEVNKIGGITYRDVSTPEREEAKDKAFKIVCTTAEYMRQMERAPPLQVSGLKDRCRVLADFNGTVLAALPGQFGVEFVTWDWDFNREGVSHGHYFGGDYKGAKQDFAIRSGLIPERIFTDEQLIEIYRCCADTLDAGPDLSYDQEKCIRSVQDQIESGIQEYHDGYQAVGQHEKRAVRGADEVGQLPAGRRERVTKPNTAPANDRCCQSDGSGHFYAISLWVTHIVQARSVSFSVVWNLRGPQDFTKPLVNGVRTVSADDKM